MSSLAVFEIRNSWMSDRPLHFLVSSAMLKNKWRESQTWSQTTTVPGSQDTRQEKSRDRIWSCKKERRLSDSDGLNPTTCLAIVGFTKRTGFWVTGCLMMSGCSVLTASFKALSCPTRATSPTLALVWRSFRRWSPSLNAGDRAS